MTSEHNRVCPVERAGGLDNKIRRWLQNPLKILKPYLREGMTALDLGCGPGFFTIDMARMVGKSGRVIACDLQEGMLRKLEDKIRETEFHDRIVLHKCEKDGIGAPESVDFVLAFYMVHEVPDQDRFFEELASIVKTNGQVLVVEPPFHVSTRAFESMVEKARKAGFVPVEGPKVLFSKTVIVKRDPQ
jgi:ubiquinone/menaquinone biosynthesis C-methylase UbiE